MVQQKLRLGLEPVFVMIEAKAITDKIFPMNSMLRGPNLCIPGSSFQSTGTSNLDQSSKRDDCVIQNEVSGPGPVQSQKS